MLTTIRKIGNSRGVLIPAAFLVSCQIEDHVEMQLQGDHIVIKPVKRPRRAGWFTSSAALASAPEVAEAQAWGDAPLADDSEWVW